MPDRTDRQYLRTVAYRDAGNLNARIALHTRFSTNPYGWAPWAFDQILRGPGGWILEVGCGPGRLWRDNAERIPGGWTVTLADLSAGMVAEARQGWGAVPHPPAYAVADVQALPFAMAAFDTVIANHMLYHVPDRARALAEMRRVLRPDGVCYAATNGLAHMRELDDLLDRFEPDRSRWGGAPPSASLGEAFTLENGAAQLSEWFAEVRCIYYEDGLVITEAAPLVAYVRSMGIGQSLTEERLAALTRFVERELARQGAIRVTKASGLFIAQGFRDRDPR